VRVLEFPDGSLPDVLRVQVDQLRDAAWPGEPATQPPPERLHDPALAATILLLVDADRVVAALSILRKRLWHRGQSFAAGGLSAVTTDHDLRRRGYGHKLVTAAHDRMVTELDLGLFTCDHQLQSFYERTGWSRLPGVVLVGGVPSAPFRSDQPAFAKVTMGDFFSERGRACRHLFVDCDVELYPGETDRLW
jgi:predicted GNAT family N-acyltransferase